MLNMNESETDIIYHITIYSKLQCTAIKMFGKKKKKTQQHRNNSGCFKGKLIELTFIFLLYRNSPSVRSK